MDIIGCKRGIGCFNIYTGVNIVRTWKYVKSIFPEIMMCSKEFNNYMC